MTQTGDFSSGGGTAAAAPPAPHLGPLVHAIRCAGIAHGACGPDDGCGRAWIEFPDLASLAHFLNATAWLGTGPYARLPWPGSAPGEGGWLITAFVTDKTIYPESDDPEVPAAGRLPEFRVGHVLHVPHGDIPEVLGRLRGRDPRSWFVKKPTAWEAAPRSRTRSRKYPASAASATAKSGARRR